MENNSSSGRKSRNVFTFSSLLFNDLICCASDVQVLKSTEVIANHLNE